MGRIEILRALFTLQLLILCTRAHFQRVSEHYMVTRTFLLILTLERGLALTSARYNSMECRPTQGFLPVHLVKGLLWSYITTHGPGIANPPTTPNRAKNSSPHFLCSEQTTTNPSGKKQLGQKITPSHPPQQTFT